MPDPFESIDSSTFPQVGVTGQGANYTAFAQKAYPQLGKKNKSAYKLELYNLLN